MFFASLKEQYEIVLHHYIQVCSFFVYFDMLVFHWLVFFLLLINVLFPLSCCSLFLLGVTRGIFMILDTCLDFPFVWRKLFPSTIKGGLLSFMLEFLLRSGV